MRPLADLLQTKNHTGNTGNTGNTGDADQDDAINLYPRKTPLQEIHEGGNPGIGEPPLRGQKSFGETTEPAPIHQEPEKNIALEPQGEALDGGQGVALPPEMPPTLTDHQESARWICSRLPEGDGDRVKLETLIGLAGRSKDDLARLAVRLVEVYGKRIDPKYRAAIWGGRTWGELTEDRRRGNG